MAGTDSFSAALGHRAGHQFLNDGRHYTIRIATAQDVFRSFLEYIFVEWANAGQAGAATRAR